MSIMCNKCGKAIQTHPYNGFMCGGDETSALKARIAELEGLALNEVSETGQLQSALERVAELTAENARLTAKGAAGDVLREAAQRVINSVSPCTHAERAALSSLYKQITAYDTAKENLND